MTVEYLKFACPKCGSNKAFPIIQRGSDTTMRCRHCRFAAVISSFRLEKRPGLRWGEALNNQPDDYDGDAA